MNFSTAHHLTQILLISSLGTISSLIGVLPANTAESKSSFIFECSRNPQTKIYSTIIKYTSGKNKELIRWKSQAIENPKMTCRDVADRFDIAWENHQLNYLNTGTSRKTGANLVCISAHSKASCDDSSKLFQLSPGNNKNVVKDLLQIIKDPNNRAPIWQSSGDEITIDLRQLIEE